MEIPGLASISEDLNNPIAIQVMMGVLPPDMDEINSLLSKSQNLVSSLNYVLYKISLGYDPIVFYFRYCDGTEFVIRQSGKEIWSAWPNSLTIEDTATYLLNPILGFVLRLHGFVCLHASAITIQNSVIVLVGDTGAGKSTTAAAFAQLNYPILTDDVTVLVDRGDSFLIKPAYPRIRLWHESVTALFGTPDALPRIVPTHPTWDKRYLDLTQSGFLFQREPLPIAAVYVLTPRSNEVFYPQIKIVSLQKQLMSLIANLYIGFSIEDKQFAYEFEILSRLVKNVPVRHVVPHTDISQLPLLLATILQDFYALT